jgi:hypothetical protein
MDKAAIIWGGQRPGRITIIHPGDAAAIADLYPADLRLGAQSRPLRISAVDGHVITLGDAPGPAVATQQVMVQLHRANFSGIGLRWLYFLSGLGGTVMVGSGLVLWVVKRRARLPDPARPYPGFRIVERLNIGIIAGAPLGIATYFLANRLLPLNMAQRAEHEIDALFIAWGAALVWTMGRPPRRAWAEVLGACGATFALVPPVNALTTSRGLLPSLMAGDTVFIAFDLAMLAAAALFALAARHTSLKARA